MTPRTGTMKQVVGVTEQAVLGKGSGDALGCVRASEHPQGCGSEECCRNCEARLLAFTALSKNKWPKIAADDTFFTIVFDL